VEYLRRRKEADEVCQEDGGVCQEVDGGVEYALRWKEAEICEEISGWGECVRRWKGGWSMPGDGRKLNRVSRLGRG
jgi:hypothetical protein